ncbi:hypothetical protein MHYP_G00274870 [Metynnis hypsauchen]
MFPQHTPQGHNEQCSSLHISPFQLGLALDPISGVWMFFKSRVRRLRGTGRAALNVMVSAGGLITGVAPAMENSSADWTLCGRVKEIGHLQDSKEVKKTGNDWQTTFHRFQRSHRGKFFPKRQRSADSRAGWSDGSH